MTVRPQSDFDVLRGLVGVTLQGLARDQHLFNGCPSSEHHGSLEMRLDGRTVLLFLDNDGESVRAAAAALKITPPFALDSGSACAWERVDLGRDPEFGRLVGQAVVRVEAVIDSWKEPAGVEVVSGWVVRFAGGDFFAYLNIGDDSQVLLNQLPLHSDPAIRTRLEVIGELRHAEIGVAENGRIRFVSGHLA